MSKIITPNPLKQGLKPATAAASPAPIADYYPKSTKTRIETGEIIYFLLRSMKIITPNPLKQGLKLRGGK